MKSSLNNSEFNPQCMSSPVANGECLQCLVPPDISNDLTASREVMLEESMESQFRNGVPKNVDAKFLEDFLYFSQDYTRISVANTSQPPSLVRKLSFNDSQDAMNKLLKLSNWTLPQSIVDVYAGRGIECMFRWQVECLMKRDVLLGGNLIYSAPTSSGKTLVAEMLMIKRILETRKKAIYVLPYISIVNEKVNQLKKLLEECGLSVGGFMGVSAPRGGFSDIDIAVCTIEKANSLVNRLIEERSLSEHVGIIVVDEVHMVSDPQRGYLLELLLTKVSYLTGPASSHDESAARGFSLQVVGMSATLPNLDALSKWLCAEFYSADFRPVELKEMIKCKNVLYNSKLSPIRFLPTNPDASELQHIRHLCSETVESGHSVLVFCPKRDWCESVCRELVDSKLCAPDEKRVSSVCQMLYESCKVPDKLLVRGIPNGVGFHHAGLTLQEREIIEGAFSDGTLKILTATTTLSSGVNLPARRVIIRSLKQANRKDLEPGTYRQMCGRAGRTGLDDFGESILICTPDEKERAKVLLNSVLKPVQSSLSTDITGGMFQYYGVKRALLEVITCGIVRRSSEARAYIEHTLLAADLDDPNQLDRIVEICFEFLIANDFIEYIDMAEPLHQRQVSPTQLGAATLSSSLPPDEALFVLDEIKRARQCFVLENELHMVYQVTPICLQELWSDGQPKWREYVNMLGKLPPDMKRVADLVGIDEGYVMSCINGRARTSTQKERKQLAIYRRFRAALALHELVNEHPLHEVADKFELAKGQLQSLQIQAGTFAGMVTTFCRKLTWKNLDMLLSQFQTRLEFGVQQELTELVKISLLNAHRARALYDKGFHNLALVADGDVEVVAKVLRDAHPFQQKSRDSSRPRKNWVSQLRRGLTEREIACEIIEEARRILGQNMIPCTSTDSPPVRSQPLSSVLTPINEILRHSQTDRKFLTCTQEETENNASIISRRIRSHPLSLLQTAQPPESLHKRIKLGSGDRDSDSLAETLSEDPFLEDSNSPLSPDLLAASKSNNEEVPPKVFPKTSELSPCRLDSDTCGLPGVLCLDNNSSIKTSLKPLQNSDVEGLEIRLDEWQSLHNLNGLLSPFESSTSLIQLSKNDFNSQESPDIQPHSNLPNMLLSNSERTPAQLYTSTGLSQCLEEEFVLDYSPVSPTHNQPAPLHNEQFPTADEAQPIPEEAEIQAIFNATTLSLGADTSSEERSVVAASSSPLRVEEWNSVRKTESKHVTFSEFKIPESLSVSAITKIVVSPGSEKFRELEEKCSSSCAFSFSFAVTNSVFSDKITSSPPTKSLLLGTAVYFGGHEVFFIEQSPPLPFSQSIPNLSFLSLAKPPTCVVAWDIKSELVHLLKSGMNITAFLADPEIALWLLQPDAEARALSKLASEFPEYRNCSESWLNKIDRGPISTACGSAIASLLLMPKLEKRMRQGKIFEVFLFNEMVAVSNFAVLEVNGIGFELSKLEEESIKIQQKMKELSEHAEKLTQHKTDLSRESEVAQLLFTHLNLPIPTSPKPAHKPPVPPRRKHQSTSQKVLEEIRDRHPVVAVVISHRKEEYALNHCIRPIKKSRVWHELFGVNRVHPKCSFHSVTGRVILENPDLQHTPKDFELPDLLSDRVRVSMRSLFTARPNCVFISADFSQLELRMLAQFSKDPTLLEIFSSKGDIFKLIASSFHGIPASEISDQLRHAAKQICYGILYGMGNESLARKMKITPSEASKLIANFKDRFKEVGPFVEKVVSSCKRDGYVQSLLGRKRFISWKEAGRVAFNTKIQSSASDLVKMGLNNTFSEFAHHNITTTLDPFNKRSEILFCHFLHDELIFEVSKPLLQQAAAIIKSSLQNALRLDLSFPVVIKSGESWGRLEKLDV